MFQSRVVKKIQIYILHSKTSFENLAVYIGIDIFVNCNWVDTRWQ